MNYIKKLQEENNEKDQEINRLKEGLRELERYLNLPKFTACEGELRNYVNVSDVLLRIQDLK